MKFKMQKLSALFNREWKIYLTLFMCSFGIYFGHFYHVFFNLNSLLSSITLDSIKNYYTFIYHVKSNSALLHFSGMNYPFGEHVVYTDCQPLITWLLRLLPFTHDHLIGILHALLFLTFIVTPLILHRIFVLFGIDRLSAFLFALGVSVLSPQFLKINAGHLALAYGCMIPLAILLLLNIMRQRSFYTLASLFIYNTLLFLIHPYMGFSLSAFSFLSLVILDLSAPATRFLIKNHLQSIFSGIIPIVIFQLFMSASDHHQNRTKQPYGSEEMVENLDSLLAPAFGPFKALLGKIFSHPPPHFEGHTYVGFATILLGIAFIMGLPLLIKTGGFRKHSSVLFFASLFILFVAFGFHSKILELLHLKITAVNQFRAVCRFAWIFYFCLPLFLIVSLYHGMRSKMSEMSFRKWTWCISALYFSLNLLEAHYLFRLDETAYWKFRNFFSTRHLNAEEKLVLDSMKVRSPQAILPLPMFHGGSELYERNGSSNSMIPSMMYSSHSGIPILSMMSSRTSITETEDLIQLMNSYKKEKNSVPLLNQKDFLVLLTKDPLLPDEERLIPHIPFFLEHDSLSMGYLSVSELLLKKIGPSVCRIKEQRITPADSLNLLYIPFENRKPFLKSNMRDFEKICVLDSNSIKEGDYVVSMWYYYTERIYQSLSNGLIITEGDHQKYEWREIHSLRKISGFYPGYGLFEQFVHIKKGKRYEFILNGLDQMDYHISHFMLRPKQLTTMSITRSKDTLINNFQP